MLAPLFHAWERYLASTSKDRKVRPFDWGLEWLALNGQDSSAADAHVERWVAEIMSDTRAFFSAPPTRDYDFQPASADAHKGEAGTLRFPTAYVTPHPENNTVHARWFPSGPARKRGRAVVVLPQYGHLPTELRSPG